MTNPAGKMILDDPTVIRRIENEFKRNRLMRRILTILSSGFRHSFLIGMSLVFLIPLFWMISTALKDRAQTWIFPPVWIPNPFIWENFPNVFKAGPFLSFLKNTLILIVWNIAGSVISTILVSYGFARLRFPGRNFLFLLMIATMMIPYQVTLIPTFLLFKEIGWFNTYLPLIVPAFTGNAFFIFFTRQYMMTIPFDLDDAARIDGCDRFQVLWRILMPLCKPPLVLVIVFTFLGVWNDFMGPLIFLNDPSKYTIAVGLNLLKSRAGTDWNLLMAASLMTVIPVLILYFFAQRHIIGGIASIGLKG
jgi:ABC-type glycerol-3-phosphate transport system permease component